MKIARYITTLILLAVAGHTPAADDLAAARANILKTLESTLSNETVTDIKPSPVAGLYEVALGPSVIYMSGDGRYVFRGDLLDMQQRLNLSDLVRSAARKRIFANLTKDEYIEFSPGQVEYIFYVFTDVDCSYCRRLHRDVPVLNDHGIGIRYLAFPRGGEKSRTYDTMQAIWCADDRRQALTDAKNGVQFASKKCKNPVADEYLLGQKIGVRGTPGIFTEDGDELPGYLPPDELIKLAGEKTSKL